jgi:hypothetical protein
MTDPVTLAEAVKEYQARKRFQPATFDTPSGAEGTSFSEPESRAAEPQIPATFSQSHLVKPLSQRLADLFGWGDNRSLRMSLYMRIQLTVQTFGKPAELALREVCDAAKQARRPGNYFAFAIVRRFRELGFLGEV